MKQEKSIIQIINHKWVDIAHIVSDSIEITTTQEALDLMMTCDYEWSRKIILHEENITPDFFSLQTGIAWDILQKIVNYDFSIAIVWDYTKFTSNSLKDFIYESNRWWRVSFVSSVDEAIAKLS